MGNIYDTGDLTVEIISETKKLTSKSHITYELDLDSKKSVVFKMHRAENTELDTTFLLIIRVFNVLCGTKIVFLVLSRTKKILEKKRLYHKLEN